MNLLHLFKQVHYSRIIQPEISVMLMAANESLLVWKFPAISYLYFFSLSTGDVSTPPLYFLKWFMIEHL